ncbi:MAG: AmmeMemoRadiSam system protein A [Actinomycetota bacterium]
MAVVIGCLMPHPPIIIPEIGRGRLDTVKSTIKAMQEITDRVAKAGPETLVFISPHTEGFADSFAVKVNPELMGSLAKFGAFDVSFLLKNDLAFIHELEKAANDFELSLTKVGKGHVELFLADELDHGVLVPLYYLSKKIKTPIVSIAINQHGFDEHYALGAAILQASNSMRKKVALIASGDLSHRLTPDAPAGYHPRAIDFDAKIEEILDTGYFDELAEIDPELIEIAGECGLRSIYTLAGAFNGYGVITKVLSYEAPFGVGYMVSAIYPSRPSAERDLFTTEVEELPAKEPEPSAPVRLAKYSLEQYFKQGHPVGVPDDVPPELINKRAGAFVCLKINNNLRGCVGTIQPTQANLAEEIMANAIQAATADPRFSPVTPDELPNISFSVDILEPPERVQNKNQLDHKVFGILVKRGYKTGLLLPDLEGVDSVDEQIAIAKRKAGIQPHEEAEIYRFKVERYE